MPINPSHPPNHRAAGLMDISIECRTRKSLSNLDISGSGNSRGDLAGDSDTEHTAEVLTSNNVVVALGVKGMGPVWTCLGLVPATWRRGVAGGWCMTRPRLTGLYRVEETRGSTSSQVRQNPVFPMLSSQASKM